MWYPKQNSVIRLKSNILPPQNFFETPKPLGWLRHWVLRKYLAVQESCLHAVFHHPIAYRG